MIQSYIKLFKCFLKGNESFLNDKPVDEHEVSPKNRIYNLVFFASIWSIGCTVNAEGRKILERYYIE